jgi:hypothetical protein
MEIKPNRSDSYQFTIRLDSPEDQEALKVLKARVQDENKRGESRTYWGTPCTNRVKLQFRRPELPHKYSKNGQKYGRGGSVCRDQNPKEADVYIYRRREETRETRTKVCPYCGK